MKSCTIEIDVLLTLFHHYQQTDPQIGRHRFYMHFYGCRFVCTRPKEVATSLPCFISKIISLVVEHPHFDQPSTSQLFWRLVTHNIDCLDFISVSALAQPIFESFHFENAQCLLRQTRFFAEFSNATWALYNVNKTVRQNIQWIQSLLTVMQSIMVTVHPHQRALLDVLIGAVIPLLPSEKIPPWFAALSFRDQQSKLLRIWNDYVHESTFCVVVGCAGDDCGTSKHGVGELKS